MPALLWSNEVMKPPAAPETDDIGRGFTLLTTFLVTFFFLVATITQSKLKSFQHLLVVEYRAVGRRLLVFHQCQS